MSTLTIVTARSVPVTGSLAVLFEARETIGLVLLRKRIDQVVDVAVHTTVQVREVVSEAAVGEAVLREVVRPHLLRAFAASDLGVAGGRLALRALLGRAREQPRAKDRHRLRFVLELAALVLARDDLACRQMRDAHCRVGGVHALTAVTAGAIEVDLQILLVDHEVGLLGFRQDGDCRGRRVDPALRLGRGHALHAVHARLELELRVRAPAGDLEDDLLEAALVGLALREDLGLPAMPLGVARVHPVEVRSEERRLFPAFARADLDDDVLFVKRVARHELGAQAFGEVVGLRRKLGDLLAGEVVHLGIVPLDELLRLPEALLGLAQRADGLDDRRERRELLTDLADPVSVRRRLGIRDFSLQLFIAPFDTFEPAAQSGRKTVGHAAASASRSPAMASSREATATSIIRASGRRVVMPCSRRPGATSKRMSGDRSCAAPRRSASYEIDATGTTSKRRTMRSMNRLTRGRNAKITIDTTTTSSRKAVPQRGCAVGYGSMRSGVSGSPCSNAWIVMCSAPWYANTRRTSGRNEIATRYPTRSASRMRPSVTLRTTELGITARARLVARYGTPMKRRSAPPRATPMMSVFPPLPRCSSCSSCTSAERMSMRMP